jgi:hypothetical protein
MQCILCKIYFFGKFFTSTIILYVLLFAQKILFLQKVGVTGLEYLNQKHKSKLGTRLDHEGHKLNKATENENCRSKGYRTAESNFFVLSGWSMVERQKLM